MKQDPNENSLLKLNEKHAQFCRGETKKTKTEIWTWKPKGKNI